MLKQITPAALALSALLLTACAAAPVESVATVETAPEPAPQVLNAYAADGLASALQAFADAQGVALNWTDDASTASLLALDHRLHTGGKKLQARISQLSARYQQITASAKYQVQGETLSGGQLRAAQVSPDRDRRKAAFEAEQQTVLAQADTLEQLLRDLVHARNDLARANGFDNFADYGDLAMQRIGYGRTELDEFCRQVQTHITPVYLRFQEEQRRRLGVDVLMPYDRPLVFPEGNAVPVAEAELPRAARRMYHALSPEAGEFFDEMVRRELLDVAASPNKISGMGFCEELAEPYRMPFVFANCSGPASDVTVYTHELGHGLQGYLSAQTQPVSDYIGLSPDLAEVHSKTMELLPLPYAPGVVEALALTLRHQPTP